MSFFGMVDIFSPSLVEYVADRPKARGRTLFLSGQMPMLSQGPEGFPCVHGETGPDKGEGQQMAGRERFLVDEYAENKCDGRGDILQHAECGKLQTPSGRMRSR